MKTKARFYELDFLRFLAAFSVLLFHYSFRGHAEGNYSPLSFPSVAVIFKYGYLGVNLFFIISGFVILITAQKKDAFEFTVSRICRLYPALWAGATITVVAALIFQNERFVIGIKDYLLNLSMISGYFKVRQVDGVYWTLLIEIKFYFLVFLLLLVKKIDHLEAALWGWLAVSVVGLYWQLPFHLDFFLIPIWSCYFIAGATFYLISQRGVRPHRVLMLIFSFLLCVKEAAASANRLGTFYHTQFSIPVITCVLLSFFILFFLISTNKIEFSSNKRLIALGALTYPLYLIHQNVGYMFFERFYGDVNDWLLLFMVATLMLLLAFLVYRFVERPLSRYMKSRLLLIRPRIMRSSARANTE